MRKVKVEAKAKVKTANDLPASASTFSSASTLTSTSASTSTSKVTYTIAHNGNFYVIEHVPARVCQETGEEFFAPETVEHIHALIEGKRKPDRTVQTPVYEYA